jgi:hypothetical protein
VSASAALTQFRGRLRPAEAGVNRKHLTPRPAGRRFEWM